jgi:glycosyltransferase involved in cell wall biosynthesis
MTAIAHVVIGPPRHGVVRFGHDLHETMVDCGLPTALWQADRAEHLQWTGDAAGLHLQFTDRVFGATPEDAAEAVRTIVATADRAGLRVTATLHDLPQPSDGRNHQRRTTAYADVCARVHAVVVSSEHERALLGGYAPQRVAVIPLPVTFIFSEQTVPQSLSVGIFGFVYPGKGHLEVLDALSGGVDDIELIVIGEVSQGHDDLVDTLHRRADTAQVRFRLTGHVPDSDVAEVLRGVTVPVTPHRHISASGSINSWLTAGRRPLAPANRYTEEIMGRNPEALQLYPDTAAGLRTAISRALDDPALTWLPESAVLTPSAEDAAAQYARLFAAWHR